MISIQNYLNDVLKIAKQNELSTANQSQTECWGHTINRRKKRWRENKVKEKTKMFFFNTDWDSQGTVRKRITSYIALWKAVMVYTFWDFLRVVFLQISILS